LIAHNDADFGAQMHRQGLNQPKHLIVRKRREDQYAQPAIILFDGRRGLAARFEARDGSSLISGRTVNLVGIGFAMEYICSLFDEDAIDANAVD
jgi:hypothetical protein